MFFQGCEAASKGDFLFSSDHLIEMATKLYRTTLSQTKQKLNIEISDEYVYEFFEYVFSVSALLFELRDLVSFIFTATTYWAEYVFDMCSRWWMGREWHWPSIHVHMPDILIEDTDMHKWNNK